MTRRIKAIVALLLAFACMFTYVACDKKDDGGDKDATQAGTQSQTQSGENSAETSEFISQLISDAESEDNTSDESSEAPAPQGNKLACIPADTYTDTDADGKAQRDPNYTSINYETMRGIWLDQYSMNSLYSSAGKQKPEANFTRMVDKVCKGIADAGFNTIIVQIRPNGDSFYPSEYYAPSYFVVGKYGNEFEYDMLKIFVETAHVYGLSFHAWVNPMRLMAGTNLNNCGEQYPLTQWFKDETKRASNLSQSGDLMYLIPGVEENKQLVWNGVTEICTNYNVDAVHIDDYFYPTMDSEFDRAHWDLVKNDYAEFGNEELDRRRYRLEQVNLLVKGMYDAVHAADPTIWFGISPAGNIHNNLNALYADVNTWCATDGYCDYIVPQVYWGFEHPSTASRFDICSDQWMKLCTSDSVRLVIGIGIYRINSKTDKDFAEYKEHDDVTKRQLEYIAEMEKNDGFVFYTYNTMFNLSGTLQGITKERKNFLPTLKQFGGDKAYTVVTYDDVAEDSSAESVSAEVSE
ncbi:MAG: family 10 glycosylhydrolase [Clostridia bacterium]|nr:family 10 glycosylhydrolase [Clostridia bacterium]